MAMWITRRKAIVGAVASASAAALLPQIVAAEPTVHEVIIGGFAFTPANIQVRPGDVIRWTNKDLAPHTATADEFGWDTQELKTGMSAEVTVAEGMEVSYFCVFHPHMKGTIEII